MALRSVRTLHQAKRGGGAMGRCLSSVPEIGSDMRDLLAQAAGDVGVAAAAALSCYQAKKWIGSFAAALCGLDTLVFAGGIGENAPLIARSVLRSCAASIAD